MMGKAFFRLLTELSSHKIVSATTGKFAKSSLSKRLIPRFAKSYGIRIEDAEKAVHEYATLNDFFTRRLKPGLRTVDAEEDAVVSPVDAVITGMGRIQDGGIDNVKGQHYTIAELLNHAPRTVNYINGTYFVLYLSPTDYHRIHAPVSGKIVETEHVSGKVYPVNDFGLRHMRKVLSRNERLITYIRSKLAEVAVVKVGALNVSSIQYVQPLPEYIERGDELAYFEFGSTVVLCMENDSFECSERLSIGDKINMGQALGRLVKA